MNDLVVRQLSATRHYAENPPDPISAGKEQQVDYVLASTYRLAGGNIHIEAQLVNIVTGQVDAKYAFDEETSDYFSLQDKVATEIENKLRTEFVTASRPYTAKHGTNNRDAYRLYVHGMYLANGRNAEDGTKAIAALEQAVALDQNYAQAWAGLGYARRTLSLWRSDLSTHETYQGSMDAINKALALDPNLSEARSALCENKYLYEWDFAGAERECKRAIELDPNSAQAHEIFSRYLMGRGRLEEALVEIEAAIDLEPASRFNHRNYGRALLYTRRYKEAEDQFKRVIAMDRNFLGTYGWLAWTLALQGKEAEAFEWIRKLLAIRKVEDEKAQLFEKAFRDEGWNGVVRQWITETNPSLGYFDLALFYAHLGEKNNAFENLEKVYQRRAIWVTYLRVDPRLDPLRDDPRFSDLLRRVDGK
jgi:tetratricopeptide (TPR) repeat protein